MSAPPPERIAEAAMRETATREDALRVRLAGQARALAAAEARADAAERALAALHASTTHRVGAAFVAAARSPRAALGLPLALARLWRAARRARQGAPAAAALAREAASLDGTAAELSLEARLRPAGTSPQPGPDPRREA